MSLISDAVSECVGALTSGEPMTGCVHLMDRGGRDPVLCAFHVSRGIECTRCATGHVERDHDYTRPCDLCRGPGPLVEARGAPVPVGGLALVSDDRLGVMVMVRGTVHLYGFLVCESCAGDGAA